MGNLPSSPEPDQPARDALTLEPWAIDGVRRLVEAANDVTSTDARRAAAALQLAGWLAGTLADYDAEQSRPDR